MMRTVLSASLLLLIATSAFALPRQRRAADDVPDPEEGSGSTLQQDAQTDAATTEAATTLGDVNVETTTAGDKETDAPTTKGQDGPVNPDAPTTADKPVTTTTGPTTTTTFRTTTTSSASALALSGAVAVLLAVL